VEIVIERQVRVIAAVLGMVTLGATAWSVTAGAAVASATTRLRSGNFHAQLVSHVLKGSDVMAAIVGIMAAPAVAFIRRRITAAS
jgi:hypothetical protein